MKKLIIILLLLPVFTSAQTYTKTYNVRHGDTVFLKTTVTSYTLDSTEKFIYTNHYNIDTVNVGDTAFTYNYTLINDTSSYFEVFKVVTGEVSDSIQVTKWTTSTLPNTANFINNTALEPYTPGTRLNDSMVVVRTLLTSQYSGLAASKQDVLVSGTNIKTINGNTVLGSGDIVISGSGPSRVFLPSDVVNNNAVANTIADVTGLSFSVSANTTYSFKFFIVYSSAATTTGSRWCINGPSATFMNYTSQYTLTATSITNNAGLSGYNLPAAASASSLTTSNIAIITGVIRPSASGTVIARFASEVLSSAITAVASGRSYVEYQIIN